MKISTMKHFISFHFRLDWLKRQSIANATDHVLLTVLHTHSKTEIRSPLLYPPFRTKPSENLGSFFLSFGEGKKKVLHIALDGEASYMVLL